MKVQEFFDPATFTLTYVIFDEAAKRGVVIDPVLDFDPLTAEISTRSADRLTAFVRDHGIKIDFILETHAHADHLTAAHLLRERLEAKIVIGSRITNVQRVFRDVFDLGSDFPIDGRQFDRLVRHGDVLEAGPLAIHVLETPGHTPACVSYKIGDAVFTGDALFIEDSGTGRCDFPNGSANELFHSVHETLYSLPDETRVFVGHDYSPNRRPMRFETTIGASKRLNSQLTQATTADEFVRRRTERDRTLAPPRLLFPSLQVNVQAGALPSPHQNGRRYLSIPLDLFKKTNP